MQRLILECQRNTLLCAPRTEKKTSICKNLYFKEEVIRLLVRFLRQKIPHSFYLLIAQTKFQLEENERAECQ